MKKFFFLFLCLVGCSSSQEKKDLRPLILVSLEPYATMVESIAGDLVHVRCVVSSKVDPHNWEPKHLDLVKCEKAKIYFTIGEGFEHLLLKRLQAVNPTLQVVSLADPVTHKLSSTCTHDHSHDKCGFDTHFWLDPQIDIIQAKCITETLCKTFPDHIGFFQNNFLILKKQLTELDRTLKIALAPYKLKIIVTSHGAFTYFCNRYGLRQFVIEPKEGQEPRSRDLYERSEPLKKERSSIIGIFIQPHHSNKAAQTLSKQWNIPVYYIDPYQKNYIHTLEKLRDDITH